MEVKGGHVEAARAKKKRVVTAEPVFQLDSDVVPLAHNKGRARQTAVEDKNWPCGAAVCNSFWSVREELLQCEFEDASLGLIQWVTAPSSALLSRDLCGTRYFYPRFSFCTFAGQALYMYYG